MDGASGGHGWLEHLTEPDRALLRRVAPLAGLDEAALHDPAALTQILGHRAAFESVFTPAGDEELLPASPFLVFSLVIHRAWADLRDARYVEEWVGPRQRLPVFGGDDLRAFLDAEGHRFFLAELLASYTRVASGSTWVRTRRGWRRRRFSELDPVRLASLLETVPAEERPGVYRRLGDLALFLTGVFPDHTDLHGLGPVAADRLMRSSGITAARRRAEGAPSDAVALLEWLGRRWYRLAVRTAPAPLTASMAIVADVAEHFGLARRTLNYLTDRYLFARRAGWFGAAAS